MTTILLIDDSEDDRSIYKRFLKEYDIIEADTGTKGIELCQKHSVDGVLLDYSLPGYDGLAVLQQIKETSPHTAVIFLTGHGDERVAVKALQAGAQDYAPKSQIDQKLLSQIIENALEKMNLQRTIKKQQEELEKAKELAEAANKAKSQFLATMSHEIRTPMNGLIMAAELLQCTELNDKQKRYIQTIETSSDILLALINDILDFSKIEAGQLILEAKPVSLRDVIEKITRIVENSAIDNKVELSCQIDKDVPDNIISDAVRIEQILINLLNNAIKFSRNRTVKLTISTLVVEQYKVSLRFVVSDTGIGIEKKKLNHIFEHFSQADSSTTRQYGGTGLGLAIVKRIVELMGGHIYVESHEGKGSKFWIEATFPTK